MRIKLKNPFKSELVRNSSFLVGGNALGQFLSFLVYPIITRLYTEDQLGLLSTFTSLCGLLVIIGTLRYEESLVIAKNDKETSLLLSFSFKLLSYLSLFLFFILLFFNKPALSFIGMETLIPYWYFIPFTVFFLGLTAIMTNLATRKKKFKTIAGSGLVQNCINSGSKITLGFFSFTNIGFFLSYLLSYIVASLSFFGLRKDFFSSFRNKWKEEKTVAWQYKDFPIYNTGRSFLSSSSINLPFLLLPSFFGEGRLGLYFLAFTFLYRPINLCANSLFSALFENASSYFREKKSIISNVLRYWKAVTLVSIPVFIVLFIWAEPIFDFVFGSAWAESALYFRYLLPWMFLLMLVSPFYFLPIVFNKQNIYFLLEIIYFVLRLGALLAGIYLNDFATGILLFCIVSLLLSIVQLAWFYRLLRKYEESLVHFH